jgi:hypothetical protein
LLAELIAEMPEPRGESSLFGGSGMRFIAVPRVVGHPSARENAAKTAADPPKDRADHTYCKYPSQQAVNNQQTADLSSESLKFPAG